MDVQEFDRFADEYASLHAANISASGEAPEYFARYKMTDYARLVAAVGGAAAGRHLDFGSGVGASIPHFHEQLPNASLVCVDVSERSLAVAEARFPGQADFRGFDGTTLPFDDGELSGAYANCVFHHIDHAEHLRLLREIRRVLRPGAPLMVYEHNPLNPLTRRAVQTCEFDQNAVLIWPARMLARMREAGLSGCREAYRVFFPHALRFARPAEDWLVRLPLGAQYFVVGYR